MQGADASVRDSEGRTALHHAVMRGHLGAVDALTAHAGPALLLQKDILGCTPVHLAAVQNQVTLILKLVTALLKDEGGRTPLHVIARQRCMQVKAYSASVGPAGDPSAGPCLTANPTHGAALSARRNLQPLSLRAAVVRPSSAETFTPAGGISPSCLPSLMAGQL